jgi:hypothetical protein
MEFRKNYTSKDKSIYKVLNNVENFISTIDRLDKGYKYNITIENKNDEWVADMEVYEHKTKYSQELIGAS